MYDSWQLKQDQNVFVSPYWLMYNFLWGQLCELQPFAALDTNDICHHPYWNSETDMAIPLLHFTGFFQGENKSLERGQNHYKLGHVESFSYANGEMIGLVHASRREQCYKVSVSVRTH